ncbi:MAG TPA: hypothetical protein VKA41_09635 [Solirubrobacterales bacterium]|nr:hypothetical protein [Solirubrobacterales bacterium]
MAGVAVHLNARHALALGLAAALLGLLLVAGRSATPSAAQAQVSCSQPYGLSPSGAAAQRFTMMIRINTQGNVDTYTKPEGGMGGRIRPQDIFVLNTRFAGNGSGSQPPMTATVAAEYAADLRAVFPCNRIIALNGMSFDPTQAGYAFTGMDDPNVFALMTDFEQGDWNNGRISDPARPPWNSKFKVALPRIKAWDRAMASTTAVNPIGASKRTGLVPQDDALWNFGQIAQDLNKKNTRLASRKLGPLSVQTQDVCAQGGAPGFGARVKQLRLQYTFKFITKKVRVKGKKKKVKKTFREPLKKKGRPNMVNLGVQISFTDSPDPSSGMALLRTSAAQAAACVAPAMKQGAGAFFFFASDDAMRQLFLQPQINALRPATAGAANTGGVGSPG